MSTFEHHAERQRKPGIVDGHVGSRVRMRRMLLGISQEKLGNMLGLTFQQVQKYEKGANRIGASRLFELAGILGVPVQYFFEDAPTKADAEQTSQQAPVAANDVANGEVTGGDEILDFLGSREGIELNRAFMSISKPELRQSIIELIHNLSDDKD